MEIPPPVSSRNFVNFTQKQCNFVKFQNEIFVLKCDSESSLLSIKNHQRDLDMDPLALSNEKTDCTGTDDDSGKDSIQFAGDYDV